VFSFCIADVVVSPLSHNDALINNSICFIAGEQKPDKMRKVGSGFILAGLYSFCITDAMLWLTSQPSL
jgi:hypothetical protein